MKLFKIVINNDVCEWLLRNFKQDDGYYLPANACEYQYESSSKTEKKKAYRFFVLVFACI